MPDSSVSDRRRETRAAWSPPAAVLACASFWLTLATPAVGYERDSHYYLRFALSLSTCFDWYESHLIASGDWGMDENGATHAEMNPVQRRNKQQWHAFGHLDARFAELWQRSIDEQDLELRMVKLGQFMPLDHEHLEGLIHQCDTPAS